MEKITHKKKSQSLYNYVESDLIDKVYNSNCPTEIETLKQTEAVVDYPELAYEIDKAWAIRQKDIQLEIYIDKLGATYF
jgi:U3 small nucleolar ribonucleoprotein component